MDSAPDPELVRAAQAGDRQALDTLLATHLPLVYSVVGRALGGHPDVDDVVQETMLRAVQALGQLRQPDRFRSWLIAIAIRQTQERGRSRGLSQARQRPLEDWPELPAPDGDLADEAIVKLGMSAQRREAANAARWLSDVDQRLLALWWQEVGGVLSRAELAAAMGLSHPHAAVRVQRMKAQLDLARAVVRAWEASPGCGQLRLAAAGRENEPGPALLRRLGRHVKGCAQCRRADAAMIPAEHLLTGAALLPVPALLAAKIAGRFGGSAAAAPAAHIAAHAATAHAAPSVVASVGHPAPSVVASVARGVAEGARRTLGHLGLKPAILGGSTLAGAAAAVVFAVYYLPASPPDGSAAAPPSNPPAVASTGPTGAGTTAAAGPSVVAAPVAPMTGVGHADLYVAPDGDDANPGTIDAPVATLGRAAALVQPGQTIALRGGTYKPSAPVTITTSGTATKRITLSNYQNEQPVIEASAIRSNQWYVTQKASYWTVQGIAVHGSPTYPYVCVGCQHTVFQRMTMYDNGATGLVLRGDGTVGNQVLDSDFHDNHDDASHGGNADGVDFKDGSGTGNVLRGCRAYHNSDDGVDLSGFADPVTVDRNWAYGNGVNRWGLADFAGGGDGIKLGGGDPTPAVAHVATDNAVWDNTGYGFTERNNKGAIVVTGNTAYHNSKDGFAFWYSPSLLRDNLALANAHDFNRGDKTAKETDNSWNEQGWSVSMLRGTDPASAEGPRQPDGTLPVTTFLSTTRPGVGATMTP